MFAQGDRVQIGGMSGTVMQVYRDMWGEETGLVVRLDDIPFHQLGRIVTADLDFCDARPLRMN